jgi:predicted  nucleic acid-binding Zn-ribbon protein
MPDLIFATKGQAEALAAQEAVTKKAREAKEEFEAGAKATQAWDSAQLQLKRSAESAMRSVATEQERVVQQIDRVKAAYREGLILKPEAEETVRRLREQWMKAGDAVKSARSEAARVPQELQKIEQPASRLQQTFQKAFDPIRIAKWASGFVSVGAAISALRKEIQDLQTQADNLAGRQIRGYQEAVEAGDTERAARLKARADLSKAFESGAQQIAESRGSYFLSSDELADLDEIDAMLRGEGYLNRSIRSGIRRVQGGGYVRVSDVAQELRGAVSDLQNPRSMDAAAAQLDAEFARQRQEELAALQRILGVLEKMERKDGDSLGN